MAQVSLPALVQNAPHKSSAVADILPEEDAKSVENIGLSADLPKGLLCDPDGLQTVLAPIAEAQRFLTWRSGPDPKNRAGKMAKVPVGANNRNLSGNWQKTTEHLLPLTDAIEQARGLVRAYPGHSYGVGILTNGEVIVHSAKTGKDFYLTGLDLDGVRDPETGAIIPSAQKYIDNLDCYWEPSPSGRGMRGLALTEKSHSLPDTKITTDGRIWGVEVFCNSKWITVTGTGWGRVRRLDDSKIEAFIQNIRPEPVNTPNKISIPRKLQNDSDPVMAALMADTLKPVVIFENQNAIRSAVDFLIEKGVQDDGYEAWRRVVKDLSGASREPGLSDETISFLHGEGTRFSQASVSWDAVEFEKKWHDPNIRHGGIRNLFSKAQALGWRNPGPDKSSPALKKAPDYEGLRDGIDSKTASAERALVIILQGCQHQALDDIQSKLGKHSFQICGAIFALELNEKGIQEPSRLLNSHTIGTFVSRHIQLFRLDAKNQPQPTNMPIELGRALIAERRYPNIPSMNGITRQPFIREDGSVCNTEGYDATSKMFCAFRTDDFPIVCNPSREDGQKAIKCIGHLFDESPFATEIDRTTAICACLTAAVRRSLRVAPGILHTAHVLGSGSGKNYAESIIEKFASETPAKPLPYKQRQEEQDKALFAALNAMPDTLRYDELAIGLEFSGTPLLLNMMTEPFVSDRVLGVSQTATVPTNVLLQLSGNAVNLQGDMRRRMLEIYYSPSEQQAFTRDPLKEIAEQREMFVANAITAISAFLKHGDGAVEHPPVRGFTQWDLWCRQSLIWYGYPDPASSLLENASSDDSGLLDTAVAVDFLNELHQKFGSEWFEAQELVASTMVFGGSWRQRDRIRELAGVQENEQINARTVGKALRILREMKIGGWQLQRKRQSSRSNRSRRWRVIEISSGE